MRQFSTRKLLAAGGALVVLSTAAVGVVQAQSTPPAQTQSKRDEYVTALASKLNIPVDRLKQAMADARTQVGLPPEGQHPNRPAGAEGFGRGGRGPRGFLGPAADAVAAVVHEDRTALLAELPGATLAEVARKHNVDPQAVVDAIVKAANDRIDQRAQQRSLPADQVTQMKQQVATRAQDFVNNHRFTTRGAETRP